MGSLEKNVFYKCTALFLSVVKRMVEGNVEAGPGKESCCVSLTWVAGADGSESGPASLSIFVPLGQAQKPSGRTQSGTSGTVQRKQARNPEP